MKKLKNRIGLFHRKFIYLLPIAVCGAFILTLILYYGVNSPLEDSWEMVPLFQAIGSHHLSLTSLWGQHNEHRIIFPLLILLANAYLTHWNTISETIIGFVFSLISITLIYLMIENKVKKGLIGIVCVSLISLWFFSPVQWSNWLWGWQLEWFMNIFGVVFSFFCLNKIIKTKNNNQIFWLIAASSGAIIASYSLATGILVWLVGLFMLLAGKVKTKIYLTWIVLGVLSTTLYYYHYKSIASPEGPLTHVLLHHPFGILEFVIAFIGSIVGSINTNLQAPDIVGSLLLLCLVPVIYYSWVNKKRLITLLPWLALILFSLLAAFSTAYGRLGYGVTFALNSRYTSLSVLYVIGLIGFFFTLITSINSVKIQKLLTIGICLFCLPLFISSYYYGIHGFKNQSTSLKIVYNCTHQTNPTNSCLISTYPNAQVVLSRLNYIKHKHWAGY